MSEKIARLGKLEIDLEELSEFLVEAKKKGYAGRGRKTIERDGSKTFPFHDGNFYYTDNYEGSLQAQGCELIRWKKEDGQRIWSMTRFGGMLPKYRGNGFSKEVYPFLKESLLKIDSEHPFRGPHEYKSKEFGLKYISSFVGDITGFHGEEKIISNRINLIVFSQKFMGGLFIPKD